MCAHLAVRFGLANPGATVWWVGPTYDDANDYGFDNTVPLLPPSLLDGEPSLTKPRRVPLATGAELSFRSAEREDSLRGGGVDLLVIDESGSTADRAWTSELRPTLTDTGGKLVAIGTPKGKRGWFYNWHLRGQDPDRPDVASWRGPTAMNPAIEASEIASAREDVPDRVFRQEYLAEFISDSGAAFADLDAATAGHSVPVEPGSGTIVHPVTIGVDLGRRENYTAIVVLDSASSVLDVRRLRHVSWKRVRETVETIAAGYGALSLAVDATRDNSVVEYLAERRGHGATVLPVSFGGASKRTMIDNLAAAIEAGEVALPDPDASEDTDALHRELGAFTYEFSDAGNIRYHAPSGAKDDTVDALALAVHARRSGGGARVRTREETRSVRTRDRSTSPRVRSRR
jgi:hypothetical protein